MEINLNKIDDETYEIVLGDQRTRVGPLDMERLHRFLSDVLRPETAQEKRSRHQAFLAKLKGADDPGIQALLRSASHDDILILLQSSEDDDVLKGRLSGNMTENSLQMYMEDLAFQFRDGIPAYQFDEAMTRLLKTADSLVKAGKLTFP